MSETKQRISDASDILGETLLALVKANPLNPQVRAQVMARCAMAVPDEFKTYDEVVDWVEHNIKAPALIKQPKPAATPRRGGVDLDISVSRAEHGTCCYTCTEYGNSTVTIQDDTLRDLASDCSTLEEVVDEIRDIIANEVWEDPGWGDSEDYDYNHHDCTEHSDEKWEIPNETIRERIIARLQAINPERLFELTHPS